MSIIHDALLGTVPSEGFKNHVIRHYHIAVLTLRGGWDRVNVYRLTEEEALQLYVSVKTDRIDTLFPVVKCTCLTELQEDAYGPGGPSSGLSKPPTCVLHK